jgi:hypothetical protein
MAKWKSAIARPEGQLVLSPSGVLPSDAFRSGRYVGIHHCTGARESKQQLQLTVMLHVNCDKHHPFRKCLHSHRTMVVANGATAAPPSHRTINWIVLCTTARLLGQHLPILLPMKTTMLLMPPFMMEIPMRVVCSRNLLIWGYTTWKTSRSVVDYHSPILLRLVSHRQPPLHLLMSKADITNLLLTLLMVFLPNLQNKQPSQIPTYSYCLTNVRPSFSQNFRYLNPTSTSSPRVRGVFIQQSTCVTSRLKQSITLHLKMTPSSS